MSRSRFRLASKSRVVAWMQANAWFVEHVEDADETGTNLSREADSLRFTAGERGSGRSSAKGSEDPRSAGTGVARGFP